MIFLYGKIRYFDKYDRKAMYSSTVAKEVSIFCLTKLKKIYCKDKIISQL